MTSSLVFGLAKFGDPFAIEMNASDKGIKVIIMQEDQPIAFISKTLSPKKQTKSVYEKELVVMLYAVSQ